jgi:hypothetical protein
VLVSITNIHEEAHLVYSEESGDDLLCYSTNDEMEIFTKEVSQDNIIQLLQWFRGLSNDYAKLLTVYEPNLVVSLVTKLMNDANLADEAKENFIEMVFNESSVGSEWHTLNIMFKRLCMTYVEGINPLNPKQELCDLHKKMVVSYLESFRDPQESLHFPNNECEGYESKIEDSRVVDDLGEHLEGP